MAPRGATLSSYAVSSVIVLAYAWALVFANVAVFIWLFVRSPHHRWPVAIMLCAPPVRAYLRLGARTGLKPCP